MLRRLFTEGTKRAIRRTLIMRRLLQPNRRAGVDAADGTPTRIDSPGAGPATAPGPAPTPKRRRREA